MKWCVRIAQLVPGRRRSRAVVLAIVLMATSAMWLLAPAKTMAACAALPTTLGTASFSVNVPTAGTYRFWAHAYSPSAGNDGFYLQLDNQYCQIVVGNGSVPAGQFTWIDYQNGATSNKINVSLSAGTHTLYLAGLDPSVGLDKILLVSDLSCVPTGQGDNCASVTTAPSPVTPPPVVSPTAPSSSTPVSGVVSLAQPPASSGVTRAYYVDGKLITGPTLNTTTLADGSHEVRTVQTDKSGHTTTTTQRILVANHPSLRAKLSSALRRPSVRLASGSVVLVAAAALALWYYRSLWSRLRARLFPPSTQLPTPSDISTQVIAYIAPEPKRPPRVLMWSCIISFAVIGGAIVLYSFADTTAVSYLTANAAVANGASIVTNQAAIGGKMLQFAASAPAPPPPPPSPNPSGAPLPGAISGYHAVCAEDFTVNAATGTWGTSDPSKVVYTGGCKWTEYPDGWPSTFTNGAPGYAPAQVLSVHDGMLDFYLHPISGHAQGANPSPLLVSGSQYQTYGKYIYRLRMDSVAGYHDAWLLWPANDSDWQYAETDFPEMDLTGTAANAYAHYGGSGAQDHFAKTLDLTQWHTYEQDWTPTSRSFYVDGQLIGTSTHALFSKSERFQLQTEPSGTAAGGTGHQYVDWFAVYAPN